MLTFDPGLARRFNSTNPFVFEDFSDTELAIISVDKSTHGAAAPHRAARRASPPRA